MNLFSDLSQPPSIDTTNNGIGAKTVPAGLTYTIKANYESVVFIRAFILGRMIVAGRMTIIN
jgi:hypothetical protein